MTKTIRVKKPDDPFTAEIKARLDQIRRTQAKTPQRMSMPAIIDNLRGLAKLMQKVGR